MNVIQMVLEVPKWAREKGLDESTFSKLEEISLEPSRKEDILSSVEYPERCCLQQALEYAENKGLINLSV